MVGSLIMGIVAVSGGISEDGFGLTAFGVGDGCAFGVTVAAGFRLSPGDRLNPEDLILNRSAIGRQNNGNKDNNVLNLA